MKVIVCGKGGSGKSTISVLIATAMKNRGRKVLLIDADESNAGLHRLLGVSQPTIFMDSFGGKKGFKAKLNNKENDEFLNLPKMTLNDIPEECLAHSDGITLLAIGKIHTHGEGCACPIGVLSKTVLSKLVLNNDDVVIIDAEAGVEHFGRGIDTNCDLVIGVVDPSYESFVLAKKMQEMTDNAGLNMSFILNRVTDQVEPAMLKNVDSEKIIARIPQNETIFMNSLEGKALDIDMPEMDAICGLIEKSPKKKTGMRLL